MQITVVNKHHGCHPGAAGEYIGRGSPLGNPFSSKQGTRANTVVASREEAIAAFREYLRKKIEADDPLIIAELTRLYEIARERPLKLICFCAPRPCHGDVIKEVLLQAHEKERAECP